MQTVASDCWFHQVAPQQLIHGFRDIGPRHSHQYSIYTANVSDMSMPKAAPVWMVLHHLLAQRNYLVVSVVKEGPLKNCKVEKEREWEGDRKRESERERKQRQRQTDRERERERQRMHECMPINE